MKVKDQKKLRLTLKDIEVAFQGRTTICSQSGCGKEVKLKKGNYKIQTEKSADGKKTRRVVCRYCFENNRMDSVAKDPGFPPVRTCRIRACS